MTSGSPTNEERPNRTRAGGLAAVLRVRVELWIVVVFMALAFGAGIVVTALYDEPQEPVVGLQQPAGQLPIAPPLSDQEIQGGLPSGHPDIEGATGADGTTGTTGQSAQGGASGQDEGSE